MRILGQNCAYAWLLKPMGGKNYTEDATRLSETSFLAGLAKKEIFLTVLIPGKRFRHNRVFKFLRQAMEVRKLINKCENRTPTRVRREAGRFPGIGGRRQRQNGFQKNQQIGFNDAGVSLTEQVKPVKLTNEKTLNSLDGLVGEQLGEGVDQIFYSRDLMVRDWKRE